MYSGLESLITEANATQEKRGWFLRGIPPAATGSYSLRNTQCHVKCIVLLPK